MTTIPARLQSALGAFLLSLALLLSLTFGSGAVAHASPASPAHAASTSGAHTISDSPLLLCNWSLIGSRSGSFLSGDSFNSYLYEYINTSTSAYCGNLKSYTQYSIGGSCQDVSAILFNSGTGVTYNYAVTGCVTGGGSVTDTGNPPAGHCYASGAGASDIGGPGLIQTTYAEVCI